MSEFRKTLATLSSAEDFLKFLEIDYEASVVHVNRLHILKRFHDYLRRTPDVDALDDDALKATYRMLLERAYQDFVHSDAVTEKVFKVFLQAQGTAHVGLDQVRLSLRKDT